MLSYNYNRRSRLNESNYNDLMKNLTPDNLCGFFRDLGITADDTKSLLIKTLAAVDYNSDEFDT
jgi:hypothetical protein